MENPLVEQLLSLANTARHGFEYERNSELADRIKNAVPGQSISALLKEGSAHDLRKLF